MATEWRCACGYALDANRTPSSDPLDPGGLAFYDGYNQVHHCPRCHRDLRDVDERTFTLGEGLALLEHARTGAELDDGQAARLAHALGLDVPVLEQLLAQRRMVEPDTA